MNDLNNACCEGLSQVIDKFSSGGRDTTQFGLRVHMF